MLIIEDVVTLKEKLQEPQHKMASKEAIKRIAGEVFGYAKIEMTGRRPHRFMKKELVGLHLARWYPETPDKLARKYLPEYRNEQDARRLAKLEVLRRRGKGPPKKGQGKRATKARK